MPNLTNGRPAFPVPMVSDGTTVDAVNDHGMTLRDYFAAAALTGIIHNYDIEQAAEVAYSYADAMLKEREKNHAD